MGSNPCGWASTETPKGVVGVIGLTSSLTLLAQVIDGFSLDTFALSYLWIVLGLFPGDLSISKAEGKAVDNCHRYWGGRRQIVTTKR